MSSRRRHTRCALGTGVQTCALPISPWVGTALPSLGPYQLSGNIKVSEQAIDLEGLALKVADSDLTGNLTLARRGARPTVTGALVSKRLDLDALSGAAPAERKSVV